MVYPFPCQDCTERYSACHDSCEQYKKARAEYDKIMVKVREDLEFELYRNATNMRLRDPLFWQRERDRKSREHKED